MRTFHIVGKEGGSVRPIIWIDWRPFGLYIRTRRWRLKVGPSLGVRISAKRVG